MRKKGFTLIELMIVVAIIALIAAFAIPALLRARLTANESGAIAALRSLVANQAQFQGVAVVDQDNDGTGEYGLFAEMAGTQTPRDDLQGNTPNVRQAGEFMAQIFGQINANSEASKSGYLFQMHLPNAAPYDWAALQAGSLTDVAGGGQAATAAPAVIDEQENYWMAYAWPIARARSGNRVFVVNTDGTIYFTANDSGAALNYSGTGNGPAPDAAFVVDPNDSSANPLFKYADATAGEVGNDGNIWIPVSN